MIFSVRRHCVSSKKAWKSSSETATLYFFSLNQSDVSGIISQSETREASLDLNLKISCRSEARVSLDGGPPRFIQLEDAVC